MRARTRVGLIQLAEPGTTEAFEAPARYRVAEEFTDPWTHVSDDDLIYTISYAHRSVASRVRLKC